jgi:AraC family transcriptional regulator of adaptative response/methylated-DNA-[protein]-cysteine methyltransferase
LIAAREDSIPTLNDLAAHVGFSAHHLQRRFKALMGVSPKAYGDECRRRRVRGLLKNDDSVAGALYEAGYGSSSRLYENADSWLGMTPASYARGGKGAVLNYAIVDCPLGRMIVAATLRGIAFLGFGDDDERLVAELHGDFPDAEINLDGGMMKDWLAMILDDFDQSVPRADLPLDVRGTAFQARVWQALQAIPPGETRTYRELAIALGKPKAARAVGRACATNPVSLIVPCHRAVGSSGSLTGYRWGVPRKRHLLDSEIENRKEK